jgi:hypothetical protein
VTATNTTNSLLFVHPASTNTSFVHHYKSPSSGKLGAIIRSTYSTNLLADLVLLTLLTKNMISNA